MSILHNKKEWAFMLIPLFFGGCSSLLPRGASETAGPWQSYAEAERTFDKIVPHQTTLEDIKKLHLDPASSTNVTVLNYSDVLRRFIPGPNINMSELDSGVQECISARMACKGYEFTQEVIKRHRYGNFLADFLNFNRKEDIVGWRFIGLVLIKNDLVVYKLSGGEPNIHKNEQNKNPLGPLQGNGSSLLFK